MKKSVLSILIAFCGLIAANAQIPTFKLTPSGAFKTSNFEDYVIYKVEGKTAHELYQMVCTNIAKVYNSPKDVMSVVEDKSVAIRALSVDLVISEKMFGAPIAFFSCYYNLLFEFKDGRIRVSAPVIGEIFTNTSRGSFSQKAAKYFDKNGNIKKNKSDDVRRIENEFSLLFYKILKGDSSSSNDDW